MKIAALRLIVALLLVLGSSLAFFPSPAQAALTYKSTACTSLIVVGVRGSNQSMSSGSVYGFGPQASGAAKNMLSRIKRTGTYRYAAIPYDAKLSFTNPWVYEASKNDGVSLLKSILTSLRSKCGTATKFALIGYSQGAHVIRGAVAELSYSVRSQIAAVGLIGDPRRRGFNLSSPDIGLQQTFSSGALYGSGLLGAGTGFNNYLSSSKVATFCHKSDPVCNRPGSLFTWNYFSSWHHTDFYKQSSSVSTIGNGLYTRLYNNGFK